MNDKDPEMPLAGGGRTVVVRRGGIIAREAGPWTPSVHLLLKHLERAGFTGAPRVVGSGFDEQGREILTYVEGQVINPAPWTNDAIYALDVLMRQLHDAAQSFHPPTDAG